VVTVVKNIDQVGIKRMNVIEAGEISNHLAHTLADVLLGELDLAHIKAANSLDTVLRMYNCWSFSLCSCKDDIYEISRSRYGLDVFEVIHDHVFEYYLNIFNGYTVDE